MVNFSTKLCKTCKEIKSLDQFHNHKLLKDGKSNKCKTCSSIQEKEAYLKRSDVKKAKAREYYQNNREKILQNIDKDKQSIKRKAYYSINKEKEAAAKKIYNSFHKEEIKQYNYEYRRKNRTKIREQWKNRLKTDPLFKLSISIRKRLKETLNIKDLNKSKTFKEYIGCTPEFLKQYIEAQFHPGMTWDNHGNVWHIDHIIPLGVAKNEDHVYQLSHYKNLRPLSVAENYAKNDKIPMCWQKFQRDKNIELDQAAGMPFNLNINDFQFNVEKLSNEHKEFINKYEWLGRIGFGVRWVFTARHNDNLAAVVMISEPNAYEFGKQEALIQRGAVSSWAPKNLNSKIVMFACRWMVVNTNKRIFVAYSDPDAGEIGTIYQACNFDYLGKNYGSKHYYKLPNNKLVNTRYFTRTGSMKKWAKELGIQWQKDWTKDNGFQDVAKVPQIIKDYARTKMKECPVVKQTSKGKYALLINYGKDKLQKTWDKLPYPKREII